MKGHTMGKATDDAIMTMETLGEAVTEIGISKVAKAAGLDDRVVRKFTITPLASKNSDITRIKAAIKTLVASKEAAPNE